MFSSLGLSQREMSRNTGVCHREVIRQYDSCNTGELDRHAQHQQPCLASRTPRVIARQEQPVLSGTHWSSFAHRQMSVVLCLRRFPMRIRVKLMGELDALSLSARYKDVYHSRHPDRCPRRTHHHRCSRRMLADMPPNWNPALVFCHSHHHACEFHLFRGWNNPPAFQQYDEKLGHARYSCGDFPQANTTGRVWWSVNILLVQSPAKIDEHCFK